MVMCVHGRVSDDAEEMLDLGTMKPQNVQAKLPAFSLVILCKVATILLHDKQGTVRMPCRESRDPTLQDGVKRAAPSYRKSAHKRRLPHPPLAFPKMPPQVTSGSGR